MQPTLCSRCKKRVAVVYISKIENGKTVNEGLCLKCAKDLGLPQVNDMMRRMGITDDDLDAISDEMMQAFGGAEPMAVSYTHLDGDLHCGAVLCGVLCVLRPYGCIAHYRREGVRRGPCLFYTSAKEILALAPPMRAVSSSLTILMIC